MRAAGVAALLLSLVAGATAEVSTRDDRTTDGASTRGTSARVEQALSLQLPASEDGLTAGAVAKDTTSGQGVRVLLAPIVVSGDVATEVAVPLELSRIQAGTTAGELDEACSRLVLQAERAGRAGPADVGVLSLACQVAAGERSRERVRAELLNILRTREAGVLDALLDGYAGTAPAPAPTVHALDARVVPGDRTRTAVRVSLTRVDGTPAAGERISVAYPGGSATGTTGADGTAKVDVPDLAPGSALPLEVSWRGIVPPGTSLGAVTVDEAVVSAGVPRGWLLQAVPLRLSTTVTRESQA